MNSLEPLARELNKRSIRDYAANPSLKFLRNFKVEGNAITCEPFGKRYFGLGQSFSGKMRDYLDHFKTWQQWYENPTWRKARKEMTREGDLPKSNTLVEVVLAMLSPEHQRMILQGETLSPKQVDYVQASIFHANAFTEAELRDEFERIGAKARKILGENAEVDWHPIVEGSEIKKFKILVNPAKRG
jgi:hypothetical protein